MGFNRSGQYGTACRHCGRVKINRPRGLCWSCYYRPGVRDLYPSSSKFAPKGRDDYGGHRLPAAPTDALPRTPTKVAVLTDRAAQRVALFHPLDVRDRELRNLAVER